MAGGEAEEETVCGGKRGGGRSFPVDEDSGEKAVRGRV